jgi:DNA-binding CsgD family transcriptional regulator
MHLALVLSRWGRIVVLTAREIEVLRWIADGKSDWQVGQILHISEKTVNFHVENMKRKFGVATRIQVVVLAVKQGAIGADA